MSDIFTAAEEGNLARVEELLAQGGLDLAAFRSDVNKDTPLYKASRRGHLNVAETLIRAGAPLNVSKEDFSPLHGAVMFLTTTWPLCCCVRALRWTYAILVTSHHWPTPMTAAWQPS